MTATLPDYASPPRPSNGLSSPVRRQQIHTRRYEALGYEREDGLFDIEVMMQDTKPFSFDNFDRGYVAAGDPLHHMVLRVTITPQMEIVDAEAATLSSPYNICPAITENYKRMIGARIVSGFTKECQKRVGGTSGCTHLNDMLRVMANTAFQAVYPVQRKEASEMGDDAEGEAARAKAAKAVLNTCHVFEPSSSIVKRYWPQFYEGDGQPADS